jgi:hypothetical protein
LDEAVKAAFRLLSAKSKEDIQEAAARFGPPAIRKLYAWSKLQRDYGLSADIKWTRGKEVRSEVLVQTKESAEVCRLIENKSDKTTDTLSVIGNLLGYNVKDKTFTLELPEGEFVRGDFAQGFDAVQRAVPARYSAELTKETVIEYATDKERLSWYLTKLTDLK